MNKIFKNLINDVWVEGMTSFANVNPSDFDDCIGIQSVVSKKDILLAVDVAKKTQNLWSQTRIHDRMAELYKVTNELKVRRTSLVKQIAREHGKVITEAEREVEAAINIFLYFATNKQELMAREACIVSPDILVDMVRQPKGTILIEAGWQYPLWQTSLHVAAALVYGNSVILSPDCRTGSICGSLAESIQRYLPQGLFQLLALPKQDTVTASVKTKALINKLHEQRKISLVSFEENTVRGCNPIIIDHGFSFPKHDHNIWQSVFNMSGQRIGASKLILVHHSLYLSFLASAKDYVGKQVTGHALGPQNTVGPVISVEVYEKYQQYVDKLSSSSLKILCKGKTNKEANGYYAESVIFYHEKFSECSLLEDGMGPVSTIIPFHSIEATLNILEQIDIGSSVSIYTDQKSSLDKVGNSIGDKMLFVNTSNLSADYMITGADEKGANKWAPNTYLMSELYTCSRLICSPLQTKSIG